MPSHWAPGGGTGAASGSRTLIKICYYCGMQAMQFGPGPPGSLSGSMGLTSSVVSTLASATTGRSSWFVFAQTRTPDSRWEGSSKGWDGTSPDQPDQIRSEPAVEGGHR
jgi:hypothetical protein